MATDWVAAVAKMRALVGVYLAANTVSTPVPNVITITVTSNWTSPQGEMVHKTLYEKQ